jgi:hypothetical protein
VTGKILSCVHSLPEWHISGWVHDSRTESFGLLAVPIGVFNMHKHILVDLIGTRRPKLGAWRA